MICDLPRSLSVLEQTSVANHDKLFWVFFLAVCTSGFLMGPTKESAHDVVRFSLHIFQYKNNGYIAGLFSPLASLSSFLFFSFLPFVRSSA